MKECWFDLNDLSLDFLLIVEVIEGVFVEEAIALSLDGHCLSDYLVETCERVVSIPGTEGYQDVDVGEVV